MSEVTGGFVVNKYLHPFHGQILIDYTHDTYCGLYTNNPGNFIYVLVNTIYPGAFTSDGNGRVIEIENALAGTSTKVTRITIPLYRAQEFMSCFNIQRPVFIEPQQVERMKVDIVTGIINEMKKEFKVEQLPNSREIDL